LLGARLIKYGHYGEAEELYRELMEARIRTVGKNQLDTINAMQGLSIALDKRKQTDSFLELMGELIATQIQVLGSDSIKVSISQERVALALLKTGKSELAFSYAEECFLLRKRVLGMDDISTLNALQYAQLAAGRSKDWELAEKWGTEAVEAFEKLENTPAGKYARSLYWFAVCQAKLDKKKAALEYARKAAAVSVDNKDEIHGLSTILIEVLRK
jgi:tetratricopeptide (TPR) repeat protein|tara:strand:- start:7777 stop:8421 length:645 start_codon:yes stop_codon:yes gene_type:complete